MVFLKGRWEKRDISNCPDRGEGYSEVVPTPKLTNWVAIDPETDD